MHDYSVRMFCWMWATQEEETCGVCEACDVYRMCIDPHKNLYTHSLARKARAVLIELMSRSISDDKLHSRETQGKGMASSPRGPSTNQMTISRGNVPVMLEFHGSCTLQLGCGLSLPCHLVLVRLGGERA